MDNNSREIGVPTKAPAAELIVADARPARERTAVVVRPAGQRLKNPRHERFSRLCLEHSQAEAYRRAFRLPAHAKPSSVWEGASKLAARPEVAHRVAELRSVAAQQTALDLASYVQDLRDITEASPEELQYRAACRHCYGIGHRYQHIDADEYTTAAAKAIDEGRAPDHDDSGGYGYDGSLRPHPSCPRCFGEGDHLFTADVTRLSPKARRLFRGFGKHGELLMHDAMQARAQLSRILGLDREDAAGIARAAAAGAAAGAALGATVATATTPEERMRAYLRLIEG